MVCQPVAETAGHREREEFCCKFGCASCTPSCIPRGTSSSAPQESSEETGETTHYRVPLAVTHLLERWEWDDKARQAVRDEGRALVDVGTWDESTVIERDDLLSRARTKGEKLHYGALMSICSVKFWEKSAEFHKHKGRICFRGDNVKDEHGAVAVFQEMSATPTTIQSANSNLAYGCLPGHKTTQADAVRAYVQAVLKGVYPTWVQVPKELWPADWKDKYTRPMCQLHKALYGHPESGGHWERHLNAKVKACGGEPIEEHPSSFWFGDLKMLMTVYVDDLLLSGPEENHDKIWQRLQTGENPIKLDPPEPLDRFLGRTHVAL